jgi:hypothetical protein
MPITQTGESSLSPRTGIKKERKLIMTQKKKMYRVTIEKKFYYDVDVKATNEDNATELALEIYDEESKKGNMQMYWDDECEEINFIRELVTVDSFGNIITEE